MPPERLCLTCKDDISYRSPQALRCADCAKDKLKAQRNASAEQHCIECGKDITYHFKLALRCAECTKTLNQAYEATKMKRKSTEHRCLGCTKDISHRAAQALYCKRCSSERNKTSQVCAGARRRSRQMEATPLWADPKLIRDWYLLAKATGAVVDHVIPLRGRRVSGLHVDTNMQLLTLEENQAKGNSFTIT